MDARVRTVHPRTRATRPLFLFSCGAAPHPHPVAASTQSLWSVQAGDATGYSQGFVHLAKQELYPLAAAIRNARRFIGH